MSRSAKAALSGLLALVPPLAGCSPGYVLRAGWEEAKILRSRRPIHEVVHDTAAPAGERAKLRLVQDAREFARRTLGLDPGRSFTSYARLERDTLILVLSAAPAHQLSWKTWWFPIVGRVPYKGFFDFGSAAREAERLRESGYDVHLRPSSAFSTLGWLPDPVLSSTLDADSVEIVETVIHEITHTTHFPPGEARFNESFANFVGHRGSIEFFCHVLRDEAWCRVAEGRWADARELGRFFTWLYDGLAELYGSGAPVDSLARGKRAILRRAADRYRESVRPALRAPGSGSLDPERLNNAWLLSRVLYYTRLDDFEAAWRACGDVRATVAAIVSGPRRGGQRPAGGAAPGGPWASLDALLAGGAPGCRPGAASGPSG